MPPSVAIPGVPMATSHALDRPGRPEISSLMIGIALRVWQEGTASFLIDLSGPYNDWVDFIGPGHREELERAMRALPRRHALPLRALVQKADEDFLARTLSDLQADPAQPWWRRRCGR